MVLPIILTVLYRRSMFPFKTDKLVIIFSLILMVTSVGTGLYFAAKAPQTLNPYHEDHVGIMVDDENCTVNFSQGFIGTHDVEGVMVLDPHYQRGYLTPVDGDIHCSYYPGPAWYVWAFITYLVGTRLLPEPQTRADLGELLRTIGFSSSPGLIRLLGIIPSLRGLVFLVAGVWMLIAMIIAVRQALDYQSTLRAVGVCLVGWIIQALILLLVFSVLGGVGKPV